VNDVFLPFGSAEHLVVLMLLIVARGADFFSTWVASPSLRLEANPVARRLGWKGGLLVNAVVVLGIALWLLPAVILMTTSLLVAARNFQSAWLSRTMGEHAYRNWLADRLCETQRGLFFFCLGAQAAIHAGIGFALVFFGGRSVVLMGMGIGCLGYAIVVPLFTWLGTRSLLRRGRSLSEYNLNSDVHPNQTGVPRARRAGQSDPGLSPTAG
jgi:hypothetical protein